MKQGCVEQDRKRIKAEGPKVQDLFCADTFALTDEDGKVKELTWR